MTAESAHGSSPKRRVIVAGYGPVGRVVVDQLEAAGVGVTIIELNTQTVDRQAALGKHIVYGDVTKDKLKMLLERYRFDTCAVVLGIDE